MQRTATKGLTKRSAAEPQTTPAGVKAGIKLRPKSNRAAAAARKPTTESQAPAAPRDAGVDAPAPDYQQLFKALVAGANAGDRASLARLRKFLDLNPHVWTRAGDLAAVAEGAWIELAVGEDRLAVESVKRRVAQLKAELGGLCPTRLESLLIDQITLTWLAAMHGEIQAASPAGGSLQLAAFRLRRAESALRRHLTAVRTLATLRSLLPTGLAPISPLSLFAGGEEKRA